MGGKSSSEESSDEPVLVIAEWTDSEWRDFPYMVGLSSSAASRGFFCGGSIISLDGNDGKGVALTAAHCVDFLKDQLFIRVGCTLTTCDDGGVAFEADRWLMHPKYDANTDKGEDEDIALIFLKTAVDFHGATAVQLHPDMGISKGDRIRQLGYGGTRGNADCIGCSDLDTLEYHWTHFVPSWLCIWEQGYEILGGEDFCTEDWDSSDGTVTTCGGDSGSPLVYKNVQLGLVSRGAADCDPKVPSINTAVPHYYDWIDSECPGCLQYANTYTSQLYGAQGGSQYTVEASTGGWIKSIKLYHDSNGINGMQLQYSNNLWSGHYGAATGTAQTYVGGDSCFSSVKVNADAEQVNGLQFTLSDGSKTPQYGSASGTQYQESGKIWGYCLSGLTVNIPSSSLFSSSTGFYGMQFAFQKIDMGDVEQAFILEEEANAAAAEEEQKHGQMMDIITVCSVVLGICLFAALFAFVCRRKRQKSAVHQVNGQKEMKTALMDGQSQDEQELEIDVEVEDPTPESS